VPGITESDKLKLLDNIPRVTGALHELLPLINPLLVNTPEMAELHLWVESMVNLVISESFDNKQAMALGQQLEVLDNIQPADLHRIQDTLHKSLMQTLSEEQQLTVYPRLLSVFGAVIGGFYVGKARRSATTNMTAASKMGHDLKTPLNAITGFSNVILKEIDGPITQFQKEDLTSIYEAGRKLLAMINDLTTVWKEDARRFGIYSEKFDVADLVAEVMVDIYSISSRAGHTILFSLERDIGAIFGDASQIRWILLTLLLYLIHKESERNISLIAKRQVNDNQAIIRFSIESHPVEEPNPNDSDVIQVTSTDMINRDIGLATAWRFCTSIGAQLTMFEGQIITFDLRIPVHSTSNENY
jgi:signal transduction histidine kinase